VTGPLEHATPVAKPAVRRAGALLQRKCDCGNHAAASGTCEECRKQKTRLRRSAIAAGPGRDPESTGNDAVWAPPIVHEVLRSAGHPLDQATRAFMTARFGDDFSRVRVHTDARAGESALAVNARAYTVGTQVVFGPGQYAPERSTGRSLLVHELAHVLQQGAPAEVAPGPIRVGETESRAEAEAERSAALVAGSSAVPAVAASQSGVLQRQPVPAQQANPPGPAQQANPPGPVQEADPGRDRVLAAAQRQGDLRSRAWEMAWRMLTRYFPEYVPAVAGVAYEETQPGVRVQSRQIERNGQRSQSLTVIVGRWFVEQATDDNLRVRIEALRYSLAATRHPLETIRDTPDPASRAAVATMDGLIRESFPLKRRRISRLVHDANQPGLRAEFGPVNLRVQRTEGGRQQWSLAVRQAGPQLFFGRTFLALPRADQTTRLAPELAKVDKWCVENVPITREDLADEDIRLRIRGLPRAQILQVRDRAQHDEVRTYADSLLGTSTPLEQGLVRAPDGTTRVQLGNVTVVIRPDQPGAAGVEGGSTDFQISNRPGIPFRFDGQGRITEFTAPPAQVTITVQTRYGPGVDPDQPSGYGRGTTERERAAGAQSLRVHEGSHGLDFVEFVRTNPFPAFTGRIGMTRRDFEAAIRTWDTAIEQYRQRMEDFSVQRTDCVGVTLDTFNVGRRRRVRARCRP
jgi:uncharacterized protein DUF4157